MMIIFSLFLLRLLRFSPRVSLFVCRRMMHNVHFGASFIFIFMTFFRLCFFSAMLKLYGDFSKLIELWNMIILSVIIQNVFFFLIYF